MSNFVTRLLGSAAYSLDIQLLPTSRLTSLPSSALVSACSKHKPMCEYHRSFLKPTLFNFDYSNDGVLHFCHTDCVSPQSLRANVNLTTRRYSTMAAPLRTIWAKVRVLCVQRALILTV